MHLYIYINIDVFVLGDGWPHLAIYSASDVIWLWHVSAHTAYYVWNRQPHVATWITFLLCPRLSQVIWLLGRWHQLLQSGPGRIVPLWGVCQHSCSLWPTLHGPGASEWRMLLSFPAVSGTFGSCSFFFWKRGSDLVVFFVYNLVFKVPWTGTTVPCEQPCRRWNKRISSLQWNKQKLPLASRCNLLH